MEKNKNSSFTIYHSQLKIIPELRFPEFKNSGEWVEKKLGDNIKEKNIRTTKNNQYPILTSSKEGIFFQKEYFNKQTASQNNIGYKIVELGDFTYRSMSDTGNFTFNIQNIISKGIVSPAYPVFKAINNKIEQKFLYFYLNNSPSIKEQIYKLKQGGTRFALPFKKLVLFNIYLPSLPEQQKIASFLSNLDELIEAHKQKLALLKQHKKGLLQNLFPSENDELSMVNGELSMVNGELKNVPKLRFPEFQNDGEWVEKKLGDFCLNISSGKDRIQNDGKFYLYGSTGIIGKTEKASYDGDFILVARVGANAGLLNRVKGQFGVTDNTLIVNLKEYRNIDFIFYLLEKVGLNTFVFGSGQPLITGRQLKELKLLFPKKQQEQQKIAECLSSLDELISAQAEKIEQLEKHKKGLMQRVFPEIN